MRHKNPVSGEWEEKHLQTPPVPETNDQCAPLYSLLEHSSSFAVLSLCYCHMAALSMLLAPGCLILTACSRSLLLHACFSQPALSACSHSLLFKASSSQLASHCLLLTASFSRVAALSYLSLEHSSSQQDSSVHGDCRHGQQGQDLGGQRREKNCLASVLNVSTLKNDFPLTVLTESRLYLMRSSHSI